ncbi:N-(5'phosphoribosyl)anthranilate isomerase [gamma proteobacterium HTCC5015]|nr:N-(5'phosphoribosyl)anthranilate isomerase [gamma proteobacterium HTCC5015]
MKRVRVKICGITRQQDAQAAVALGADALGFVFYRPSPRFIEPSEAARIIRQLPAFVTTVGLFMDADATFVRDATRHASIDLLQFHGRESAEFCRQFDQPYIKAVPMRERIDLNAYVESFSDSRGLLLDSTRFGVAGGSGECFDWSEAKALSSSERAIIMAGGIKASNVAKAVAETDCYGVDVSSGVEDRPGHKSPYKMKQFFDALKAQ